MASVTLNQELDSVFLKGLRLLHSSEPDAEEQLQQLWKQSVIDKYGAERTPTSILHKITVPSALKRENQDVTSDTTTDVKRPKLEVPLPSKQSISASPKQAVSVNIRSNNSTSDDDSDKEPPLEILNTEGVCLKCKGSTSSVNNKLVECVDCHQHYHQMCHFPPISDMDLSDPRFVWYCSSCDQNITTTNDKSKISTGKSGNSSKGTATTSKSGRVYNASSSKSSAHGNVNKSSKSNSKDSSSSSNTSERKGHMMKKRSARKLEEKK